jgi:multiple sugar transport system substrate-binding protein
MASGWFDYLNLRINGAAYHRELLAGKHSFEDPQVTAVLEQYARLIPYFHPNQTSWDAQQAVTPMVNNEAARYLVGAFCTQYFPADQRDDLDFFSVPPIDPSVPSAEEAPTDGFFAAANSQNPEGAKQLLSYLASAPAQQEYIEKAGSSNLPTSPDVDTSQFSPLVQKGIQLLNETDEITQFFQPRLQRRAADHRRLRTHAVHRRPVGHPRHSAAVAAGAGLHVMTPVQSTPVQQVPAGPGAGTRGAAWRR